MSTPATDKEGFLINNKEWSEELAIKLAKSDGISLTSDHWLAINTIRHFYFSYNLIPTNRALIKAIREHKPDFSSIDLQKLFPESPIIQLCKIAGLEKPERCI